MCPQIRSWTRFTRFRQLSQSFRSFLVVQSRIMTRQSIQQTTLVPSALRISQLHMELGAFRPQQTETLRKICLVCVYNMCVCAPRWVYHCVQSKWPMIYMDGSGSARASECEEHAIERTTFQGCRAFRFHSSQTRIAVIVVQVAFGCIWIHLSKVYVRHCPGAPSPQPLLKVQCWIQAAGGLEGSNISRPCQWFSYR